MPDLRVFSGPMDACYAETARAAAQEAEDAANAAWRARYAPRVDPVAEARAVEDAIATAQERLNTAAWARDSLSGDDDGLRRVAASCVDRARTALTRAASARR